MDIVSVCVTDLYNLPSYWKVGVKLFSWMFSSRYAPARMESGRWRAPNLARLPSKIQ